jgi:hypothetical protein
MSGMISYELFTSKMGINGFTSEGGMYEYFVNNTGTSVKGTIVIASTAVDNAVDIAPANSQRPIGIIYENNITNGSLVKVVVYGKAQVLLKDGEVATNGYWCGVSNFAGRMSEQSSVPNTIATLTRQIGHSLESKSGGTNVLSIIQLCFS